MLDSDVAARKFKDKRTKLTEQAWASFDKAAARQQLVNVRRSSSGPDAESDAAAKEGKEEVQDTAGEGEEMEDTELTISSALGALSQVRASFVTHARMLTADYWHHIS